MFMPGPEQEAESTFVAGDGEAAAGEDVAAGEDGVTDGGVELGAVDGELDDAWFTTFFSWAATGCGFAGALFSGTVPTA